jgi:hypothetical protein
MMKNFLTIFWLALAVHVICGRKHVPIEDVSKEVESGVIEMVDHEGDKFPTVPKPTELLPGAVVFTGLNPTGPEVTCEPDGPVTVLKHSCTRIYCWGGKLYFWGLKDQCGCCCHPVSPNYCWIVHDGWTGEWNHRKYRCCNGDMLQLH